MQTRQMLLLVHVEQLGAHALHVKISKYHPFPQEAVQEALLE